MRSLDRIGRRTLLRRSALALLLTLGLDAALAGSELERRVTFETAQLALARGETTIGSALLDSLAVTAPTEAERLLYRLVAKRARLAGPAEGTGDETSRLAPQADLARLLAAPDLDRAPAWVADEVVSLASLLRLEQIERDAADRLDAVLTGHRRAHGGAVRLAGLRSVVVEGTLESTGGTARFRLLRSRPGLYRFEVSTPSGLRIEAADRQAAWRSDPRVAGGRPVTVSGAAGEALREGSSFLGPLLEPAGAELRYAGVAAIDGRRHHVVEVFRDGAARRRSYVDAETLREVRTVAFAPGAGTESASTVVTTEHRMVDGHLLPSRQVVRVGATVSILRFERYRLNEPLGLEPFDAGSVTASSNDDSVPPASIPVLPDGAGRDATTLPRGVVDRSGG